MFYIIIILNFVLVDSYYKNTVSVDFSELFIQCPNDNSYIMIDNLKNKSLCHESFYFESFNNLTFGRYTCIERNEIISTTFELGSNQKFATEKSYTFNSKTSIKCLFNNNFNVDIGSTLILECNCGSLKNKVELIWFKEGMELKKIIRQQNTDATNTSLILNNINYLDSGEYGCSVNKSKSRLTFKYKINVLGFQKPTDQVLEIGDTAKFVCIFSSMFNKNASFVKISSKEKTILNITQVSKEDFTYFYLIIKNLTKFHSGLYSCIIKNSFGVTLQKNFTLSLIFKYDENSNCQNISWTFFISIFLNIFFLFIIVGVFVMFKVINREPIYFIPLKTFKKLDQVNLLEKTKRKNKIIIRKNIKSDEVKRICYEIDRKNLKVEDTILGFGDFGVVKKAELKINQDEKQIVAVKTLKEFYRISDFYKLLQELQTMIVLGYHENIIDLIGCCTTNMTFEPLQIVYKYAPMGNLKKHLKKIKNRTADLSYFLKIAFQIANGMEFISTKGFLHRDLAARNILLFPNDLIKICDFGLAKIVINDYFKLNENELVPFKWLPYESLKKCIYSSKSDVYMYGVLIWEMYTFGDTPFKDFKSYQNLIHHLKNRNKLKRPRFCKEIIFNFMEKCWEKDPIERPSFNECKIFFHKMSKF